MQWIKAHLMVVITGSVGLVGVVMFILGFFLMDPGQDMEANAALLRELRGVKPLNAAVIEQARRQQDATAKQLDDYIAAHKKGGDRKPLHEEVFASQPGSSREAAARAFMGLYVQKQLSLLEEVLNAQDAPTELEFKRYEDQIIAKQKRAADEAGVGLRQSSGPRPPAWVTRHGTGLSGTTMDSLEFTRLDARRNLSVLRAHSISCYANLASLDERSEITNNTGVPTIEDMWYAQVAMWVQEDVIGSLARLNKEAGESLPEEDRWVGHLPVKHLVNIRLGNYVAGRSGGSGGGRSGGRGGGRGRLSTSSGGGGEDVALTGGPDTFFTKLGHTTNVDVLRFSVDVVVEATAMLKVIDVIGQAGFYTPVLVTYQKSLLDPKYVYGEASTVQVSVVYDACFLRSTYEKWMPETVAKAVEAGTAGGMSRENVSAIAAQSGARVRPIMTGR